MENSKGKKVCLLIPDGVGIRNYLYTGIIEHIDTEDIVIWHSLPDEVIDIATRLHNKPLVQVKLKNEKESLRSRFLREAAKYARIINTSKVDHSDIVFFHWMPRKNGVVNKLFYGLVEMTGRWAARKYDRILWLEQKHADAVRSSAAYHEARQTIIDQGIGLILCTHQRSIEGIPVMLAATDLQRHAMVAIFSWDNMPKATLTCRGNRYLVWSDYMKAELEKYHPEIAKDRIEVTGTPQFEFYARPDWIESKETFYARFGLPLNKRLICFSGDDAMTSPFDELFLEDVCKAVSTMDEAERPVIIFRGVPVESSERYQAVIAAYPGIVIESRPLWKKAAGEGWNLFYPLIDDMRLLVNLGYHCEGVINFASTMALDFTMFDKPALYFKYNHDRVYPRWDMIEVYLFQHFRTLDGLDALQLMHSPEEILPGIRRMLNDPGSIGTEKLKWRNRIMGDIRDADRRIAALVNALMSNDHAAS